MKVTYIGHATLLLEIGGATILTDPNFDDKLGGYIPRVSAPGLALDKLPALDAVLVTHAHVDHLSFDSINRLPRDIPLFAPPAVTRWLDRKGYGHGVALAPESDVRVKDVTIAAAMAQHEGSRYGYDRWRSAANMYLLDAGTMTCFFAGDTGLSERTHRIVADRVHTSGRRLDVALLPIGHGAWWKRTFRKGHLTSDDALVLHDRLDARYFIPYHWGTFNHVTSGAFDAMKRLRELIPGYSRREEIIVLEPGQSFKVPEQAVV